MFTNPFINITRLLHICEYAHFWVCVLASISIINPNLLATKLYLTLLPGNNAICFGLWEKRASAPIHALHFGFGIGAFIAPQLARPFISPTSENSSNPINSTGSGNNETESTATLWVPYTISSFLTLIFFIIFLSYFIHERRMGLHSTELLNRSKVMEEVPLKEKLQKIFSPGSCTNGQVCFGTQFFIILFVYYINAVGGERAMSKFLYSYAIDSDAAMTSDEAATLNSVFWISFTCGRGVTIVLAKFIPPTCHGIRRACYVYN